MSVFGKSDSRRLSNFLQTHIFRKFDHISRTYNQISYRNIWFAKVIIINIMMTQVLFSIFFSKKTRTLMPLSKRAYFNQLLRAVPARSALFEKWNAFFYTKNFKDTFRLGGCTVLNALNLEKWWVQIYKCVLLLDFLDLF